MKHQYFAKSYSTSIYQSVRKRRWRSIYLSICWRLGILIYWKEIFRFAATWDTDKDIFCRKETCQQQYQPGLLQAENRRTQKVDQLRLTSLFKRDMFENIRTAILHFEYGLWTKLKINLNFTWINDMLMRRWVESILQ